MIGQAWADGDKVIVFLRHGGKEVHSFDIKDAIRLASDLPEAIRSACEFKYYSQALQDEREGWKP